MAKSANHEKNCAQASCFIVRGMSRKSFRMVTKPLSHRPSRCIIPPTMSSTPTTPIPADKIITW